MRIEISTGFLDNSVSGFQDNFSSYLNDAENVISSFKTIQSQTSNLNGGMGTLEEACNHISARIQAEENKLQATREVKQKSQEFVDLAIRVDKSVAKLVDKNKDEFYRVNPWLKHDFTDDLKDFIESAKNWLIDRGKEIVDDVKNAIKWIGDTAKKIGRSIADFYEKHKNICKILIGVAVIAAAFIVVIATGGTALAALAAAGGVAKAALISGAIGAVIGGGLAAIISLAGGNSWEETLPAALQSALDGFASGFMLGSIFGGVSQGLSILESNSSSVIGNVIKPISNFLGNHKTLTKNAFKALCILSLRGNSEEGLISTYENSIAQLPNIKVGEELLLPIGNNSILYCTANETIEGNSDVDVNLIVEDQKVKLKNLSAEVKAGNISLEMNTDLELEGGITWTDDAGDTYTIKKIVSGEEVSYEETIKTNVEGGSVSTTIGIKHTKQNFLEDYVPVLAYDMEPVTIGSVTFDLDKLMIGIFIFSMVTPEINLETMPTLNPEITFVHPDLEPIPV